MSLGMRGEMSAGYNIEDYKSRTHKPIALAKWRKPPSDKTQGELRPDIITYIPPRKLIMRADDLREE
jgi:hypothetical protein